MPAVYAHRRFGEKVLAACQNDVARTAIESYPDLYNIGLQGPDILFYYDPLRKNPTKPPATPCTTPRLRPSSRRGPPM